MRSNHSFDVLSTILLLFASLSRVETASIKRFLHNDDQQSQLQRSVNTYSERESDYLVKRQEENEIEKRLNLSPLNMFNNNNIATNGGMVNVQKPCSSSSSAISQNSNGINLFNDNNIAIGGSKVNSICIPTIPQINTPSISNMVIPTMPTMPQLNTPTLPQQVSSSSSSSTLAPTSVQQSQSVKLPQSSSKIASESVQTPPVATTVPLQTSTIMNTPSLSPNKGDGSSSSSSQSFSNSNGQQYTNTMTTGNSGIQSANAYSQSGLPQEGGSSSSSSTSCQDGICTKKVCQNGVCTTSTYNSNNS